MGYPLLTKTKERRKTMREKQLKRDAFIKIDRPYTQADFAVRVEKICRENAQREAFLFMRDDGSQVSRSFAQVWEGIQGIASGLQETGVVKGDRVALISPIMPAAVLTGVALGCYGATAVLIDPTLPKEEIMRLLTEADVRGIFAIESVYASLEKEKLAQVPVYKVDAADMVCKAYAEAPQKVMLPATTDRDEDVAAILFSSGTTASMKGIMLTWHSVMRSRDLFADVSGMNAETSYLVVFPYNHVSGYTSTMMHFLTGCSMGMIENVNASKLAEGLQAYNPHHFGMVPKVYDIMADKIRAAIHEKGKAAETVINGMIRFCGWFRRKTGIRLGKKLLGIVYKKAFGKNIRGLAILGTPCSKETADLFLDMGIEWANMYATTETNAFIACTGVHDVYPENSVGNVHRYEEDIVVKINNPDEKGIGEVYAKSGLMMKGYFRDEKLTEEAFEDGYFKTGDLGYLDEEGNLFICGRSKDTIMLHNGKKISATDVDAFYQHLSGEVVVASCAVATEEGYDELHLFMEQGTHSAENMKTCEAKIREKSSSADSLYHLAGIHVIQKLPMTSVGKVKRYLLKEELKQENVKEEAPVVQESLSIEDTVLGILAEVSGMEVSELDGKLDLKKDLGIDSLNMFELVSAIGDKLHVDIAGSLEDVSTVADLIAVVKEPKKDTKGLDLQAFPEKKSPKDIKRLEKWMHFFAKTYDFKVTGLENIPKQGNYIISSNHINNLDPIWLLAAMEGHVDLEKCGCLAEVHLYEKKTTRKLFKTMGSIPVERSGNTVPAMNRCKECLQEGMTLVIFPEGARSRDGSMLPFKNGVAKLAMESGKPILPVGMAGGFEIFPRHKKVPRIRDWKRMKKLELTIRIGAPIYPEEMTESQTMETLRSQIESLSSEVNNA